ncbi:6038_t:CDS:2, partial [Gigaspora rosea]
FVLVPSILDLESVGSEKLWAQIGPNKSGLVRVWVLIRYQNDSFEKSVCKVVLEMVVIEVYKIKWICIEVHRFVRVKSIQKFDNLTSWVQNSAFVVNVVKVEEAVVA